MATRHLIAYGKLTFLSDIAANHLVYAGRKLVAVLSCKLFYVNNDTVFAVRNFKRCISYFLGLFAEDSAKKSFFSCKLGFALGRNLTNKDVTRVNLCTDTDNSSVVKVAESIVAYVGNISGDFFRSELGISCFDFVFFNVD